MSGITFPRAKKTNRFKTRDKLTAPRTVGSSWPVDSMVLIPWMLFQRMVVSMLTMNHTILRTTTAFHTTQQKTANRPPLPKCLVKTPQSTEVGVSLTSCGSILSALTLAGQEEARGIAAPDASLAFPRLSKLRP